MSSRGGCLSSSAAAAGMQSFQSHKTTPHQPTTTMDMMPMVDAAAAEESSSASSSSSLSPPTSPLPQNQQQPAAKRRAGRKKFRETRHPVYRGVRARAGGRRWVCEVREPKAQARIWLGTYPTPEMAARAHDVAAIALRGAHLLNFPDSAHTLPRARTAAPDDIRCAAAQAAELYRPASTSSGSGSPQQMQMPIITTTTMGAPQPPAVPEEEASSIATATCCCPGRTATGTATACFLDEDAIFDMPGLIDDMARGMLLTPPAMARGGLHLDWGALDDNDDHAVDYCTLWMD